MPKIALRNKRIAKRFEQQRGRRQAEPIMRAILAGVGAFGAVVGLHPVPATAGAPVPRPQDGDREMIAIGQALKLCATVTLAKAMLCQLSLPA